MPTAAATVKFNDARDITAAPLSGAGAAAHIRLLMTLPPLPLHRNGGDRNHQGQLLAAVESQCNPLVGRQVLPIKQQAIANHARCSARTAQIRWQSGLSTSPRRGFGTRPKSELWRRLPRHLASASRRSYYRKL